MDFNKAFKANPILAPLVIFTACLILFMPFLGGIHLFDWDEVNFAEAAREMIESENYLQIQIDYLPFYEKPPLFLWFQVVSYKLFGIHEFSARFPNAIFGAISMVFIYLISRKHLTEKIGRLWVLMFMCSLLPHLYFRSGIIDPVFNFFIYSSLILFYLGWIQSSNSKIVLAGILIGLGILAKGPVAILIAGACLLIYGVISKNFNLRFLTKLTVYSAVGILIASLWFLADYLKNGPEFITQFFKYQIRLFSTEDAGHGGFPGYHVVVLLFGCFPASIYALRSFKKQQLPNAFEKGFVLMNKVLFFLVLILFSIVQSKIVHYSSLCYFPLCFLAAFEIDKVINTRKELSTWIKVTYLLVGSLIAIIFLVLANIDSFPDLMTEVTKKDKFATSIIDKESPWRLIDNIPFLLLLTSLLGFIFIKNSGKKVLFASTLSLLFVVASIYIFPSRIEYYTQRDLVEYIGSLPDDAVIYPINHKSYAHLFYSQKEQNSFIKKGGKSIMEQDSDNDIYVFSRIDRPVDLIVHSHIMEVTRIPGYIIYLKTK